MSVKIKEDTFTLPDGASAYRKSWIPFGTPVATLIHIHGFSEHINRYNDFFPALAKRGILCTGIDQRGWGKSVQQDSDRGNSGTTATVLSDLASLFKSYLSSSTPLFVMGHSMGGAELLTMASTPEYKELISQLGGILLESPYIDLPPAAAPYAITVFLGRLAGRWIPKFQILNEIKVESIVTDPIQQKAIADDPLCHGLGTLEMFSNMLERAADLVSGKLVLNEGIKALWLAHGSGDLVTSCDASRKWFDREGPKVVDREFKEYDGWSHQLHIDTPENGPIFAKDVGDWILKRSS